MSNSVHTQSIPLSFPRQAGAAFCIALPYAGHSIRDLARSTPQEICKGSGQY